MSYSFAKKIFKVTGFFTLLFCSCIVDGGNEFESKYTGGGINITLSEPFGVITGTSFSLKVKPSSDKNKIYYTLNGTPAETLFAQGCETEGLFLYDGQDLLLKESKNPEDYDLTPNVVCGRDNEIDPVEQNDFNFGYISKGIPLSFIEVDDKNEIVAKKRGTYVFQEDGTAHFKNIPVVCLSAPVDDWIGEDKNSGVYNTLTEELKIRAQLVEHNPVN